MKPRIGLVVPALAEGGGVPAVAQFLKNAILGSSQFDLSLVSLSMAANDPCSVRLAVPTTWLRGVTTSQGFWEALLYSHVGASLGEFKFQRYRSRMALARALAVCDLIQVVCAVHRLGRTRSSAWASRSRCMWPPERVSSGACAMPARADSPAGGVRA